jgi:hypothetical protein
MKNTIKLFGIIALVAVIGFLMVACDLNTDPTILLKNASSQARDFAVNQWETLSPTSGEVGQSLEMQTVAAGSQMNVTLPPGIYSVASFPVGGKSGVGSARFKFNKGDTRTYTWNGSNWTMQ